MGPIFHIVSFILCPFRPSFMEVANLDFFEHREKTNGGTHLWTPIWTESGSNNLGKSGNRSEIVSFPDFLKVTYVH